MSVPITVFKDVRILGFTQQILQTSTSINVCLLNIILICAEEKDSRTGLVAANGVIDVVLQQPLCILVSHSRNLSTRVSKGEKVAVGSGPAESIICRNVGHVWRNSDVSSKVDTISVCKEPKSGDV